MRLNPTATLISTRRTAGLFSRLNEQVMPECQASSEARHNTCSGPQGLEPCPPDQKDSGAVRCAKQGVCRSDTGENHKVLGSVAGPSLGFVNER
jgi:hypothetical protein